MTEAVEKKLDQQVSKRSPVSITNFAVSDVNSIKPQESQKDFKQSFSQEVAEFLELKGMSYTMWDENNEIISILGVVPVCDVGVAWAVHSDLFHKYSIEITKTIRRFFDDLSREGKFKKFITSVTDEVVGGDRWAKFLKFTPTERHPLGFMQYERLV